MDSWHPAARRVGPGTGGAYTGVPWKIVLHTTESKNYSPNPSNYYGSQYWPHATITPDAIYQHIPISQSAKALAHKYAPETNRANAIQCEIAWQAADPNWSDALLDRLAEWVKWVQRQVTVPTRVAEMWRQGVTLASVNSPIRFTPQAWLDFNGICGHSNVPGGNDHWDPGRLPIDRLVARLKTSTQEDGEAMAFSQEAKDYLLSIASMLDYHADLRRDHMIREIWKASGKTPAATPSVARQVEVVREVSELEKELNSRVLALHEADKDSGGGF